jgi:hypothetical protein
MKDSILSQLTTLESEMLLDIVSWYDMECNTCYNKKLTPQEKGVIGSLIKKGFVYDSFAGLHNSTLYDGGNFFPSDFVLDAFKLPHF